MVMSRYKLIYLSYILSSQLPINNSGSSMDILLIFFFLLTVQGLVDSNFPLLMLSAFSITYILLQNTSCSSNSSITPLPPLYVYMCICNNFNKSDLLLFVS